ncbi:hypothetical protein DPMN_009919 [Dreissena polymorpha]|uniref:Uncharacterized protein n=1 Tax=Dreissena polymorpha TaxID=45954 RepID=A0A9D4MXV0_DREPO|nr:hypothetical protein DPMN_009919 [Dreissena polymorpha]
MAHYSGCTIRDATKLSVRHQLPSPSIMFVISAATLSQALSAENLQVGFRKTGLFPLNKDAIPRESMFPAQVYHSDDTDDSDLTVEGGLQLDLKMNTPALFFETVEQKIRSVKNQKAKKPRKTVSRLVSGKEPYQ